MQRATGVFGFQSRPFGPGLLNAILSEYRLTGGEDGADGVDIKSFGDCDQCGEGSWRMGRLSCGGDAREDIP